MSDKVSNKVFNKVSTRIPEFMKTRKFGIGVGATLAALTLLKVLYINGGVCRIERDLRGKTVLITGANTGIGKETARVLAGMGANVILACRSRDRTQPTVDDIIRTTKNQNVRFLQLDLSSLDSVEDFSKRFLREYPRLDILILNAGIMMIPKRQLSAEGQETQFSTNHLAHFLLTNLLMKPLKAAGSSRVIVLSSMAHKWGEIHFNDLTLQNNYSDMRAYAQSKLANVMFARQLQKNFDREGLPMTAVSVHPGGVRTELTRNVSFVYKTIKAVSFLPFWYLSKSPLQGAQTSLYCALEDQAKLVPGAYYADCKVAKENKLALDDSLCQRLWNVSVELVKLEERLRRL
jgi:retinol dehydrogenase 12